MHSPHLRTLALGTLLSLGFGSAQAAVFDAADFLPPNAGAIGGFGEILLTDPTSEGIEARGRYGLSEDWNIGAILGTGTKEKNFRFGGEGVFNLLPDWEQQLGLSFLGSAVYLRRNDTGGLQMRVGPLLHKRLSGWTGLPASAHLGLLWQLEARGSNLTSGSQLVAGTTFDVADGGRTYMGAELGIRLAKADSYVLVGVGMRLGDLSFQPKAETKKRKNPPRKQKTEKDHDGDYTDEDFQ